MLHESWREQASKNWCKSDADYLLGAHEFQQAAIKELENLKSYLERHLLTDGLDRVEESIELLKNLKAN